MEIGKEIKKLAVENGLTLTYLAKCIAENKGKNYTIQNFSTKLKKGTINYNELVIILKELGYEIELKKLQ